MAEEKSNPFNLSLFKQQLQIKDLEAEARGLTNHSFQLQQPSFDVRGLASGRPESLQRGLGSNRLTGPGSSIGEFHTSPSGFLRELESIQRRSLIEYAAAPVSARFNSPHPGNVSFHDLTENDQILNDETLTTLIKSSAKEFDVSKGVLAEHLIAETHIGNYFGKEIKKIPAYTATRLITSTELGLDDFVKERNAINKMVKRASTIRYSPVPAPSFPPEKIVEAKKRRGDFTPVDPKFYKPQVNLDLNNGVRAVAAYLKYKERIALGKENLGKNGLKDLPLPIKYQLLRLMINSGGQGSKYWIDQIKRRDYQNLFDFREIAAKDTTEIHRRATIHTARALHFEQNIFGDEE